MNRVHEAWCDCGHILDAHGRYSRDGRTQCAIPDCDCPRPRNENLRLFVVALLFIAGCVLGLWALSGCLGGPA
jgi:hypothetical protein